jgi:hypothetical protein
MRGTRSQQATVVRSVSLSLSHLVYTIVCVHMSVMVLFRIQSSDWNGGDVMTLSTVGLRISHPFGLAHHDGELIVYK